MLLDGIIQSFDAEIRIQPVATANEGQFSRSAFGNLNEDITKLSGTNPLSIQLQYLDGGYKSRLKHLNLLVS